MKASIIHRVGIKYIDGKGIITELNKDIEVIDNGQILFEKVTNKSINKSSISRIQSVFDKKSDNINLYSYCYDKDVTNVREALRKEFYHRFNEKERVIHRLGRALADFRKTI